MDIDSGNDLWGSGEYKTEENDSKNSVDSTLTSLGYSGGGGADPNRGFTQSESTLLTPTRLKTGVILLGVLVALLLLLVLFG